MTQITTEQYELLVNEIYSSIMGNPDMGMGEMGEARDEGKRIVEEWMEKTGITFEATSEERGQDLEHDEPPTYEEFMTMDGKEAIGEHTPGPWKVEKTKSLTTPYEVWANGRIVADLPWGINTKFPETWEEVERNAALIASAPALVKENRQLKEQLETGANQYAFAEATRQQQAKDIEELREALDAVLAEISPAYNFDLRNAPEPIKKATELLNRLNKKTPL